MANLYTLRPIHESDAEMLLQWRNAEHVRMQTLSGEIITPERHKEWIRKSMLQPFPTHYIFSSAQRSLGTVGVKNLDENLQAEWGFHFGVTDAPKGAATIMLSSFLKIVFEKMRLHRLIARVAMTNEKSVYLHQKLGFVRDTVKSGEINRHSESVDVIYYHYDAEHWHSVSAIWLPITSQVTIEDI